MSSRNPYSLREIFDLITMELIESLRRTFSRHQAEQLKEGFQWEQWQRAKLRSLAAYRRENAEIVGRNSKAIFDVITEVLDTSFDDGRARAEREILQVLFPEELRGRGPDAPAPPESQFFKMNKEKLQALQETVIGDMEKAQHAVLRKMDDVYRQTIFRAQVHMASGAKTLNQAVDMSTQEFLDKGIQCIEYKDGRRVNVSSYAEMALRTASQRATFMGEGTKRNEWGVHTIVVSAHATSCDLCVPWQARVLIDDVYSDGRPDGQYPLLSTAMKAGLLHPNCRHTLSTFFPGVSRLPKSVDEETAWRNYEAEQRQRAIERQIRRWKRREVGSLDPDNYEYAHSKVKEWQSKMREHLEENPQLRRAYYRERVNDIIAIETEPFQIGRSLGAMAKRFYVKSALPLRDGVYYIKEGTEVTGVTVMTSGTKIREVERLMNDYPLPNGNLTHAKDWHKVAGKAIITNGELDRLAEVHWYQCKNIGKVEFKEKIRGDAGED